MRGDDNSHMSTPLPAPAALQGATPLSDWGVIRARGEDARSFLQGQLTQDVLGLDAGNARLAGYCSAKGRLLASFVAWRNAPDDVLLACSADLLAPTLKRLSMFVLRAKCKLSDGGAEIALWGLAGDAATAWLGADAPPTVWSRRDIAGAAVIRLPDARLPADAGGVAVARYLWAAPTDVPAPALPALDADGWRWLEVFSGVARIVAATGEQFVPQMVNLELVGGVNFQKGCYPGQEVVARSQYRGTLKRRGFVALCDAPVAAGAEVFHSDDPEQPAGRVALAARQGALYAALLELKLAAVGSGSLHAGQAGGPLLRLGSLPYTIPAEAA
jgi:folate-binding protein YgfZ